ncbi:PREDICTED: WAS/WASL-interacting protein family member 3-like [Dipodomys ordii]|uniref:WAS/WASL-interacting protein family member 3-like n=1 Tax=Dipodomys ordii TaxID=10020 RepID=A0A1S3FTC0_DIPOR|nr:PREDICTED: WAS/WASL-interacting protein family member 3-like [Dipodomys ordii]
MEEEEEAAAAARGRGSRGGKRWRGARGAVPGSRIQDREVGISGRSESPGKGGRARHCREDGFGGRRRASSSPTLESALDLRTGEGRAERSDVPRNQPSVRRSPPPPPDPGSSTRTCDQHRASGVGRTQESFNTSKGDLPLQPPFSSVPPTAPGSPPPPPTHPPRCPLADTKYRLGNFPNHPKFLLLGVGGDIKPATSSDPRSGSPDSTPLSAPFGSPGGGEGRDVALRCGVSNRSHLSVIGGVYRPVISPHPHPTPITSSWLLLPARGSPGAVSPQPIRLAWPRGWGTKLLLSSTLNFGAEDCLWSVPNSGLQAKTIIFLTACRTLPLRKAWTFLILSPKFRTDKENA